MPAPVKLTRHPPERRPRSGDIFLATGSCCCSCCLHTVGAFVGAMIGSAYTSEPPRLPRRVSPSPAPTWPKQDSTAIQPAGPAGVGSTAIQPAAQSGPVFQPASLPPQPDEDLFSPVDPSPGVVKLFWGWSLVVSLALLAYTTMLNRGGAIAEAIFVTFLLGFPVVLLAGAALTAIVIPLAFENVAAAYVRLFRIVGMGFLGFIGGVAIMFCMVMACR